MISMFFVLEHNTLVYSYNKKIYNNLKRAIILREYECFRYLASVWLGLMETCGEGLPSVQR
jgi:hypothetical protein